MKEGEKILHYEILAKLGEGGMGVVYKAQDTRLGRTVALKFLPSHLIKSEKDNQRFIRESKSAAALNHPNICSIHAVEESEDHHFISMEYIDGVTLHKKLRSGDIAPKTALEYGIRIAEALAEAHEKGIVHRDIKPGNIMVDSKNRIKVMDFGLAKLAGSSPITQTGTTIGTMAYMSPEQIQGRPVDHRADLFAFGILLFEMLAGQRPFGGQYDAALFYSIVNEDPPLLSGFLPNAPQKLVVLVNRLLEKDPAKRYSDAEQLAVELRSCLDQLPDSMERSQVSHAAATLQKESEDSSGSGSTSITIALPSWRSRNGMLGLAGMVIALVLIGYWVISLSGPGRPEDNKIAVLPLESFSNNSEDVQFTDGVHEELINRLARIGDLTVIARSSVLRYLPDERNLQNIGQELGVSSLIEGTVRRVDDRIRVFVQLIDVNTLGTLWSGSFDDNIDDVFEIQSRIARQVASELQASLTQQEQQQLDVRPTENPQAYRLYMQGRAYLSRTVFDQNNLLMAEELLSKSLEEDPEFAQAWGMLAIAYSRLYWHHGQNPEVLEKMGEAAEQARVYGPDLAETYLANGVYLYWSNSNNHQTLSHFETALQRFPNQSLLYLMTAYTHRRMGNWEQLVEHLNKALELDPLNTNIHTEFAWDYYLMRDYDEAERALHRTREVVQDSLFWYGFEVMLGVAENGTLDKFERWWDFIRPSEPALEQPNFWSLYNFLKRDWEEAIGGYKMIDNEFTENSDAEYIPRDYMIGLSLNLQGHRTEALEYFEQARNHLERLSDEYPDEFRYRMALGKVYASLGENEKAVQEGKRAIQLMPFRQDAFIGSVLEEGLTEIYAWTNHEELAIEKLEELLSIPSMVHRNEIRIHPIWDPLRDHPRFQELIAVEDEPYLQGL